MMHPSQGCETRIECTNPMPGLAGLHAITQRLLRMNAELCLLPVWSKEWTSDFNLHAPGRTFIEGSARAGDLREFLS